MTKKNLSKETVGIGEYNFDEVFNRICKHLHINTQTQLAKIVRVQPQAISEAKRTTGFFPVKWAVILSDKYDLSLDFILKGEKAKPVALPTPKNKLAQQALHFLGKASAKIRSLDKALEHKR